ncbi:hypothetical protein J6590_099878 [Homalodisca vitripennis]|nr:hypothetical protein J6590_099878 [Homalodisca vitripennis]
MLNFRLFGQTNRACGLPRPTVHNLRSQERLTSSEEQCVNQLISEEIGDRKPSQFLRHLYSPVGAIVMLDNLLRKIRLWSNVSAIFTTQLELTIENGNAKLADLRSRSKHRIVLCKCHAM